MPIRVAILAIPEVTASVVHGLYDVFASVRRDWSTLVEGAPKPSPFEVRIVGRQVGPLLVGNGLSLGIQADLTELPDVVCVPEVMVAPTADIQGRYDQEIDFLKRCREADKVVAATCSGALLLAEAGLLAGHEVTTHWLFADRLRRYPGVEVREKLSLVIADEGHLVMAGGGTTWASLALYFTARYVGVEEAVRTARMFLMDWNEAGQAPYVASGAQQSEDAIIARCQIWIAEHYEERNPVAAMLELSQLSERSFHRRFKQATGQTPMEYVHAVRIEEAKQQLETTSLGIDAIAVDVGYEDASFFGRLFRRRVGLTPSQYRKRFGGLRKRLQAAVG